MGIISCPNYIYASPRTREDVAERLLCEIRTHENFIRTSVKGDYGEDIHSFFSMPYCLMFHGILDCNELKSVLFRSLVVECYQAGICLSRKKNFPRCRIQK